MMVFIFLVRGLSLGVFQGFFVYAPEVSPSHYINISNYVQVDVCLCDI